MGYKSIGVMLAKIYGTRQKECNKHATVALENVTAFATLLPPKVPHFDGCATVRRLVKRRNPRIVAPFAGLRHLLS